MTEERTVKCLRYV